MIQTSNDEKLVSIYNDGLTKKGVAIAAALILKAFPKFDKNQLEVLKERFKANEFTSQRAIDSVNHLIDTYEGWDKLPNLANFIQFDKQIRVYSYNEVLEFVNEGEDMNNFEMYDNSLWRKK